eukprot:8417172-Pyramimonas_sp.AAC.2
MKSYYLLFVYDPPARRRGAVRQRDYPQRSEQLTKLALVLCDWRALLHWYERQPGHLLELSHHLLLLSPLDPKPEGGHAGIRQLQRDLRATSDPNISSEPY